MSYSRVRYHLPMLLDSVRNRAYADAMSQIVTRDSIVLDLGAGLGIHGLIAAKLGARRVYFVEPEPVVKVVTEIAARNGLADRVEVLETKIEDVDIPEKVDLIVSALTGNLLFSEDLLKLLYFARDKFLKPGGQLVPDVAQLVATPVSAPAFYAEHIHCVSQNILDLDFSPVRRFLSNEVLPFHGDQDSYVKLGADAVLEHLDLQSSTSVDCESTQRVEVSRQGKCHGLLVWIRLRVGRTWLSSAPSEPRLHWKPAFLPIDPPLDLTPGERFEIQLKRPAYGDWTWLLRSNRGTRRHSSFLSQVVSRKHMRSLDPEFRPRMSRKGLALRTVLEAMNGETSNRHIASQLFDEYSDVFVDEVEALDFVRTTVRRYSSAASS